MTIGKNSDNNPPMKTPALVKTVAKNEGKPAQTLNRAARRALARQEKEKLEAEAQAKGQVEKVSSIPLSQLLKQMEGRVVETVKDGESSSSEASVSSSSVVMKKDLGAKPKSTQAAFAIQKVLSQPVEGLTQSLSSLHIEETGLAETIFLSSKKVEKDEDSGDEEWEVVADRRKAKREETVPQSAIKFVEKKQKFSPPFILQTRPYTSKRAPDVQLKEYANTLQGKRKEVTDYIYKSDFLSAFKLLLEICVYDAAMFTKVKERRRFFELCGLFFFTIHNKHHEIGELKSYSEDDLFELSQYYHQEALNLAGLKNLKLKEFPEVTINNLNTFFLTNKMLEELGRSECIGIGMLLQNCWLLYSAKESQYADSIKETYRYLLSKVNYSLDDLIAGEKNKYMFWRSNRLLNDLMNDGSSSLDDIYRLQEHMASYINHLEFDDSNAAVLLSTLGYSYNYLYEKDFWKSRESLEKLNVGLKLISKSIDVLFQDYEDDSFPFHSFFINIPDICTKVKENHREILGGILASAAHLLDSVDQVSRNKDGSLMDKISNLRSNADRLKPYRVKKSLKKQQEQEMSLSKLSIDFSKYYESNFDGDFV